MEKNRWNKVRDIFTHINDQSPSFRSQYLDMVCEDDPDLRTEVEKMLRANDDMDSHPAFAVDRVATDLPDTIAGYRIISVLGRGGMSTVYAAEHSSFGDVALKVLPANLVSRPVAKERFRREATLLQKVDHPALCRVFEIAVQDSQAVIAMERAPGMTLEEALLNGSQSVNRALGIAETIADVLAVTHRHGVVHRDLKPSNIVLDEHNGVKLIDFGIAKFADANLTATGEVMGSPRYMSPEQWRGEPVGPETDIWSLGVVLVEQLTGSPLFNTDTVKDTAQMILGSSPVDFSSLTTATEDCRNLHRLLQSMLQKDRLSRISSMDRVYSNLRQISNDLVARNQ